MNENPGCKPYSINTCLVTWVYSVECKLVNCMYDEAYMYDIVLVL